MEVYREDSHNNGPEHKEEGYRPFSWIENSAKTGEQILMEEVKKLQDIVEKSLMVQDNLIQLVSNLQDRMNKIEGNSPSKTWPR